jgi:hypothetical protein
MVVARHEDDLSPTFDRAHCSVVVMMAMELDAGACA